MKKIYQYQTNGKFIRSYDSIVEAQHDVNSKYEAPIRIAAKNNRKSHGYFWSFKKYDNIFISKKVISEVKSPEKVSQQSNGKEMTIETNTIKTLPQLLKAVEANMDVWDVSKWIANKWDMTDKHGNIHTNWQVKAWLDKKIEHIDDLNSFKRSLIEDLKKEYSPKIELKYTLQNTPFQNLLLLNIPDLHLGKQSWAEETGFRNYDIKIAVDEYNKAVNDLLSKAVHFTHIDKILFVVGNDLFNSDNAYPLTTTTAGTPQQDDVRWQKVFKLGRNLMIETIEKLKLIASVDVKVIPGNHDFQKSFYLGDVLEIKYEHDPNVNVDNSPKTRKYYNWGNSIIGLTHGARKDEGEGRLFSNMSHEGPKHCETSWKDIKFKTWYCGDIHHYKEVRQKGTKKAVDQYAEDIDGVLIKYLRTLMFNDEWEAKKGFISQKGAHCFVINNEQGEIAEFKYNS